MDTADSVQFGCLRKWYPKRYGESCRLHGKVESDYWINLRQMKPESLILVRSGNSSCLMYLFEALDWSFLATFSVEVTHEFPMWTFERVCHEI